MRGKAGQLVDPGEAVAGQEPSHRDGRPTVLRRGAEGLGLLADAYQYARELNCSLWDFAVEIETLQAAGCTNNEFRWLVCNGYVQHAPETTLPGEPARAFRHSRRPPGLTFGRKTCFVLTDQGFDFAQTVLEHWPTGLAVVPAPDPAPVSLPAVTGPLLPKWDRERQELRVGATVVKQFKVPAANQERILAAFEEEGWPVHIDDPLPPASDQDSKRRLHDTINSLNRNQRQQLLHFLGDGTGQGIRWELINPGAQRT
jgi:hypothetical protein